jgi:hypothetical protein
MIETKGLKPVPVKKKVNKDPIRYPKVISVFEDKSKKDFSTYLAMETKMLITEINR